MFVCWIVKTVVKKKTFTAVASPVHTLPQRRARVGLFPWNNGPGIEFFLEKNIADIHSPYDKKSPQNPPYKKIKALANPKGIKEVPTPPSFDFL